MDEKETKKVSSTTSTKKSTSTSSSAKKSTTTTKSTTAAKASSSTSATKKTTSSKSSSTAKKTSSPVEEKKKTASKEAKSQLSENIAEKTGLNKADVSKALTKVSKLPLGGKIAVGLCFVLGAAGGYVGMSLLQRNDQFTLVNGNSYTINVGDTYNYEDINANIICVSYGRNAIDTVSIDKDNTNVDFNVEGEYKITYISNDIKYKKIPLVQTIFVVSAEDAYIE